MADEGESSGGAGVATHVDGQQDGGVSVLVQRTIKPGCEADYEAWLSKIIGAARRFPGHLGANVVRPPAASSQPRPSVSRRW